MLCCDVAAELHASSASTLLPAIHTHPWDKAEGSTTHCDPYSLTGMREREVERMEKRNREIDGVNGQRGRENGEWIERLEREREGGGE